MKRLIAFIVIVVVVVGWFIFSTIKEKGATQLEGSPEEIHVVVKDTD